MTKNAIQVGMVIAILINCYYSRYLLVKVSDGNGEGIQEVDKPTQNIKVDFKYTIRNDFSHMDRNEVRVFKINKLQTRTCNLDGTVANPNIIELRIKKEISHPRRHFFMVGHANDVYLNCYPGKVEFVKVQFPKAQGCGISKILTRLCLNEKKIHTVQERGKNMAMLKLQGFPWWDKTPSWVTTHCKKIVYLQMVATPANRANLYFMTAKASKFTKMFITQVYRDEIYHKRIYPEQGPCCISELQNQYDDNGNMVKDGKVVNVFNSLWFFCFPKRNTPEPCCTIL